MELNEPSEKSGGVGSKHLKHPVLTGIAIVIGFIVIVGVIGALSVGGTEPSQTLQASDNSSAGTNANPCSADITSSAVAVDYKQLEKDPDSFKGKVAKFTGQVVQIIEFNGITNIRLAVTKTDYGWDPSNIIYIEYDAHTDAVEDDVVTVYGIIAGNYTYTSQANFKISVPSMLACVVKEGTAATATVTTRKAPVSTTQSQPTSALVTQAPEQVAPAKTWHSVYNYSNGTTIQTPPFALQGSEQRITYGCLVTDSSGGDSANLFNGVIAATSGYPSNTFASFITCPSQNTSYVYANPPGQYYLDLTASNASYTVTVEDYY